MAHAACEAHTVYTSATIVIRHSESKGIVYFVSLQMDRRGGDTLRCYHRFPCKQFCSFRGERRFPGKFDVFKEVKAIENNWRIADWIRFFENRCSDDLN